MKIREIKENKKQFLSLLLLADEQENMIDRYLERGTMYVLNDNGVKAECVVTDEGNGILEIKNIATVPEYQGKGYAKALIDFTLTDRHQYEVIAVFKTVVYTNSSDSFKYYEFTDAENAAEFDAYVAKCKELSLYDTGVSAEYGDKLISLSTCEYSRNNGRLVVVAKRVD